MLKALQEQAGRVLAEYLMRFPEESEALRAFQTQLGAEENCFVRSNMVGHVTTSAAILNPDRTKILLIHHRFLNIWMPPGGHYEEPDTFWESAKREVSEETGVATLELYPWCTHYGAPLPLDIDTHSVPPNSKKGEGVHKHHDFRFLAVASDESELVPQLEEVLDAKWAPLSEIRGIPNRRLTTLADKLQRLGIV